MQEFSLDWIFPGDFQVTSALLQVKDFQQAIGLSPISLQELVCRRQCPFASDSVDFDLGIVLGVAVQQIEGLLPKPNGCADSLVDRRVE